MDKETLNAIQACGFALLDTGSGAWLIKDESAGEALPLLLDFVRKQERKRCALICLDVAGEHGGDDGALECHRAISEDDWRHPPDA